MNKIFAKDNFLKKVTAFKNIIGIFGVIFLVLGFIFIALSFYKETLDDKYIVKKVTEYKASDNDKLSEGEMNVSKTIDYREKGIYKIKYINYAKNNNNNKSLISNGSYFTITDILGKGYALISDKVIINEKEYKLNDGKISSENGINISCDNNTIVIEISEELLTKKNIIEIYIKLIDRKINFKYQTSQESYFSFTPNGDNDFYNKKSLQSYIIEGEAYIELDNK